MTDPDKHFVFRIGLGGREKSDTYTQPICGAELGEIEDLTPSKTTDERGVTCQRCSALISKTLFDALGPVERRALLDVARATAALDAATAKATYPLRGASAARAIFHRALADALPPALSKKPDPTTVPRRALWCPCCGERHVEHGVDAAGVPWSEHPHRTHLCAACGATWRLDEYAFGVATPADDAERERRAFAAAMADARARDATTGFGVGDGREPSPAKPHGSPAKAPGAPVPAAPVSAQFEVGQWVCLDPEFAMPDDTPAKITHAEGAGVVAIDLDGDERVWSRRLIKPWEPRIGERVCVVATKPRFNRDGRQLATVEIPRGDISFVRYDDGSGGDVGNDCLEPAPPLPTVARAGRPPCPVTEEKLAEMRAGRSGVLLGGEKAALWAWLVDEVRELRAQKGEA